MRKRRGCFGRARRMARREKKTIISCASIKYLRMPEVMMMIKVMVMIIEIDDNGESV